MSGYKLSTINEIVYNNTLNGKNRHNGEVKYPTPNQSRRETWQELVNQNRGTTVNSANGRGNPLYSPNPTHITVGAPITELKNIYPDKYKESTNKQNNKKLVSKQSAAKSTQKKVPSKTTSNSSIVKNGYHTFKYENGNFYRMNVRGEIDNKPVDIDKLDSQVEKNLLYQKRREFGQSKTAKKPSSKTATSTSSKTTSIPTNLPSGNNKNISGWKEKTPTATTKSVSTNKVKTTNSPQTKSIETTSTTTQSTTTPDNSIKVQNTGNKRPTTNWNNRAKSILGEDLNDDGVIDSKDVSWLQNQYNQNKSAWNNAGYQTISNGNYSIDGKIGNTTKNLWEWYKQNRAKVSQPIQITPVITSHPVQQAPSYEDIIIPPIDTALPGHIDPYDNFILDNRIYY